MPLIKEEDRPWLERLATVVQVTPSYKIGEPLMPVVDKMIDEGCLQIETIRQRTRQESLAVCGNSEEAQLAETLGNALLESEVSQRSFLQIDERIAALSRETDCQVRAQLEHDCMKALTVNGFGYESANPGDNMSINDIMTSARRGCGGVFVQTLHWLQQLGLKTYACKAREDIYGAEGHFSFLFRDSRDDFWFLDPAPHLKPTQLADSLFDLAGLVGGCAKLDDQSYNSYRLNTLDANEAYKVPVHPRMVIGRVEDARRELILHWLYKKTPASEREALIERWLGIEQALFPFDGLSDQIMSRRADFLNKCGNITGATAIVDQLLKKNPQGLISLPNAVIAYLLIGDVFKAYKALRAFLHNAQRVIAHLYIAIAHRAKTDCAPGGRVLPVLSRLETIRDYVKKTLEITTCFIDQIQRISFKQTEDPSGQKELIHCLMQIVADFIREESALLPELQRTAVMEEEFMGLDQGSQAKAVFNEDTVRVVQSFIEAYKKTIAFLESKMPG